MNRRRNVIPLMERRPLTYPPPLSYRLSRFLYPICRKNFRIPLGQVGHWQTRTTRSTTHSSLAPASPLSRFYTPLSRLSSLLHSVRFGRPFVQLGLCAFSSSVLLDLCIIVCNTQNLQYGDKPSQATNPSATAALRTRYTGRSRRILCQGLRGPHFVDHVLALVEGPLPYRSSAYCNANTVPKHESEPRPRVRAYSASANGPTSTKPLQRLCADSTC